MKTLRYLLLAMLVGITTSMAAKPEKQAHVYMFGFSASFKDSVVYITEIHDVQGAWTDSKTKFLLGLDNYLYQLKDHLNQQLHESDRVCMVFFDTDQKKAEKKYQKLRKKYQTPAKKNGKKQEAAPVNYEIRLIQRQDFKFEPIDMSTE